MGDPGDDPWAGPRVDPRQPLPRLSPAHFRDRAELAPAEAGGLTVLDRFASPGDKVQRIYHPKRSFR